MAGIVKRWSPTGCVFATAFLLLAVWCLASAPHGDGGPLWLLQFLTLPVSYVLGVLDGYMRWPAGLSADAVGWAMAAIEVLWGMVMFYGLGWLLERPLRR